MNKKNLTMDYMIWYRMCQYRIYFCKQRREIKVFKTPKQKRKTKNYHNTRMMPLIFLIQKNRVYHNNHKFTIKQKMTGTSFNNGMKTTQTCKTSLLEGRNRNNKHT